MKYARLGDLLVDAGYITAEQLDSALSVQKEKHQRLGETLVSEGIITERNLIDALTMQLGIAFIDLTPANQLLLDNIEIADLPLEQRLALLRETVFI